MELLATLSSEKDKIWPTEKWPPMKFKDGIKVGSKGGHGPIKYVVEKYDPNKIIEFRFLSPNGFNGIHKFEIAELEKGQTELIHTIDMKTSGKGTLTWIFAIRSLHNALIEDGLDKVENYFSGAGKSTKWSWWTKLLRKQLAKKRRNQY